jgi:NAD(P)-dependent dehydrogenase (short-subunit alcohol dehydrogenase family)
MPALEGKVALVAGGGTGIGRATAIRFAAEGAAVAVFGRREAALRETVRAITDAGGRAALSAGDAGVDADVEQLVATAEQAWGGVDVLVNCAAIRHRAPLAALDTAAFAEVVRINLVGAFALTRAMLRPMRARGGGSIVHVGSALGTVAVAEFAAYVASKGGLHQLARAAAVELVSQNIRVNVVAPGAIDTDAGEGVGEFRRRMLAHRIPVGRAGHVDDVAHACLYLASNAARYVTGAVLAVDGGWTAA